MTYFVYNYEADGERAADFDPSVVMFDTLDEARREAAARLDVPIDDLRFRKWIGFEADDTEAVSVEAYHEHPFRAGCGGVQISASPATLRSERM